MPSPATSASDPAQASSSTHPPPRTSTDTTRSRTARSSTGGESVSSLWRLKTQSLLHSIRSRNNTHHAISTGRSAWEWLSVRHARMTARIKSSETPRPSSAAAGLRRPPRSGILEATSDNSSNCMTLSTIHLDDFVHLLGRGIKSANSLDLFDTTAMPRLQEPARRKSLGDLLNAFALRLNIDRALSTDSRIHQDLDCVDTGEDVSQAEELPPPVIDMPVGLMTCLERSNSLRQGVEQTFKDWSGNKKDFGQKTHKIPLMPISASEFRRTVEQRRALRENAYNVRGPWNASERHMNHRHDTRSARQHRQPRPPFAALGCTGIKPEDLSTCPRSINKPDARTQNMPYPIPPKRVASSNLMLSRDPDLDDIYKDCVGSLPEMYRQVLTDIGVTRTRDPLSESLVEFRPASPCSPPTVPSSPTKTLPVKFLKARLDNTNVEMYLQAQSQSVDNLSRNPPDYIPESWLGLAFHTMGRVGEPAKVSSDQTKEHDLVSVPLKSLASRKSLMSTESRKEVTECSPSASSTITLKSGRHMEGGKESSADAKTRDEGDRPSDCASGCDTKTIKTDPEAVVAPSPEAEHRRSKDGKESENTPSSPSEYSHISGRRYWSEDSGQDSPATDVSSVKHLSQARGTKLGKIEEDDSSSQCSSEDRFFKLETTHEERVTVGTESSTSMTTNTTRISMTMGEA
ncbi:hypothetical protein MKZ38_010758 [Zalerion maritima]|uniref:Uncharacterized protein n=1 Tax=Zalerion maritima TaxID=339359 RepID=A0AAD5WYA1_9PEZI|nr:hypothetical protein MKZ38_010758 [Zalerion maritima]